MQALIAKPIVQAAMFMLLSMVLIPIFRPKNAETVWSIAGVVYALFIVANSILVCFVTNVWPYFWYSMLLSFAYLVVAGLVVMAYLKLAGTQGSNESGMVFVVIMYHPVALLVMIFLRWAYSKLA
jgi:hypothetical protein